MSGRTKYYMTKVDGKDNAWTGLYLIHRPDGTVIFKIKKGAGIKKAEAILDNLNNPDYKPEE